MLQTIVEIMTPFLIAALGGLFTEKAGVLNIALEGLMLIGAFSAAAIAGITGSLWYATAGALAVTGLTAYLYATVGLRLKANIFIAALAVNLFALGITQIASQLFFATKGVVQFPNFPVPAQFSIPLLSQIPFIGSLFSEHSIYVYLSWLLVPLTGWILYRTPFGYHVRAAGSNETALFSRGISGRRIKELAITISGLACGLAGATLSINLGAYVPNITSGRGWIALVAIFIGYKKPAGILLVSFLFAGAELIAQNAQGIKNIPSSLLLAFPFFITFIGMVLFSAAHSYLMTHDKKADN